MITTEQVKAALDEVARERPGHIDGRVARQLAPRYVEHGKPCCLVGVVLHRLGFTVAQLRQFDNESGRGGGGIRFAESRHPLLQRITPEARLLLDYLQRRQDIREDWAVIADRALQRDEFTADPVREQPMFRDHIAGQWAYETFPWNTDSSTTSTG